MPGQWQRSMSGLRRRRSACALLALLVVAFGTVLSQTGPPRNPGERPEDNRRREPSRLFFRPAEDQQAPVENAQPGKNQAASAPALAPRQLGQGRMLERARQRFQHERPYTPARAFPKRGFGYSSPPRCTPVSVLPEPVLPQEVPIYDSLRPRLGLLDVGQRFAAAVPEEAPAPKVRIVFDDKLEVLDLGAAHLPAPKVRIVFDDKLEVVDLSGEEANAPAAAAAPVDETVVPLLGPPASLAGAGAVPAILDPASASSGDIELAGCAGCGSGGGLINPYHSSGPVAPLPPLFPHAGCSSCGVGMGTCAGIPPCYPCEAKTVFGRFFYGVYQCICCPDPCYDPRWLPIADAAFFTEAARPITQTRLRWDTGLNLIFPDRSEYFWSRSDGAGLGPTPTPPLRGPKRLDYIDLSLYAETASDLFSFSINTPYRNVAPETIPNASGFGDIDLATKTLLYDCELFQIAMMMRTYILSGNFKKGLGAGHITLEPSFVVGLRIGPETYLQTQFAEWIPFGTPGYSGSVLRVMGSLNHTLYRLYPNVPLVGTMEFQGLYFQSGSYTDPTKGSFQPSAGGIYFSVAPGLRLFLCDKIDAGVGTAFSVTEQHFAEQLFRAEFRLRF